MAQAPVAATLCALKTEVELSNISGCLYDSIERTNHTFGIARAIEDSSNRALVEFIDARKSRPGDINCSDIRVDVKFRQPDCGELPATNDFDFDCTTGANEQQTYLYDTFTFNNQVSTKFSVAQDAFMCSTEDPREDLAITLATNVRKMYKDYNRKLGLALAQGVGAAYGSTDLTSATPLGLKLFTLDNVGRAVPQPMAIYDVVHEYMRQAPDCDQRPVLISGSKKIGAYEFAGGIFAGNDEGQDASRQALGGAFIDWQLPAILNGGPAAEPVISFLPGSIDIVDYYHFDNPDRAIGPDGRISWAPVQASGTLVRQRVDVGTPILGRRFDVDMQIYYDECNNVVTYTLRKEFDLWKMPTEAFCAGDLHNYCLLWDIQCAPYDCTDIC